MACARSENGTRCSFDRFLGEHISPAAILHCNGIVLLFHSNENKFR